MNEERDDGTSADSQDEYDTSHSHESNASETGGGERGLDSRDEAEYAEIAAAEEAIVDEILDEWGPADGEQFQEQYGHAQSIAQEFIRPSERDLLVQMGLDNHPALLRVAARLGRELAELRDGSGAGGGHPSPAVRQGLEQRLDNLTAQAHEALRNGDRRKANRLFSERDKISQRLDGGKPVVGGSGRIV